LNSCLHHRYLMILMTSRNFPKNFCAVMNEEVSMQDFTIAKFIKITDFLVCLIHQSISFRLVTGITQVKSSIHAIFKLKLVHLQ
jgi:hypothetical protein